MKKSILFLQVNILLIIKNYAERTIKIPYAIAIVIRAFLSYIIDTSMNHVSSFLNT